MILCGAWLRGVISSPFAGGPTFEPFCDLLSVEEVPWLPLRFRLKYFSIASASRSRIRFAIGDSADAGLTGGPNVLWVEAEPRIELPIVLCGV